MARKVKPDPVKKYQPICSFVYGPDAIVLSEREWYLGSDPAVQSNPKFFVEIGTPREEWPDLWNELERPDVPAETVVRPLVTVDSPGALRVRKSWRGFLTDSYGRKVTQVFEAGKLTQEADPVVKMIRASDKKLYSELFGPAK